MKIKKILLSFVIILSSVSNADLLKKEDYDKIKNVFLSQAKEQGAEVAEFKIADYLKITEDELNTVKSQKELLEGSQIAVADFIINKENLNEFALLDANDGRGSWVMPTNLHPTGFLENNCSYLMMIGSGEDCLALNPILKNDLKNFLKYHNIHLNEEYLSDFYFIHELVHLLPNQKKAPEETDVTRIWIDDVDTQYSEVYADLFTAIFLNNHLNYDIKSISNIVKLRDFNLTANDDLRHYSTPYIKELFKDDSWLEYKSFEDIDIHIKKIYLKVNKDQIISKKQFTMIHHENFTWCNNLDISLFKSKEELNIVIYHCKKMKKD